MTLLCSMKPLKQVNQSQNATERSYNIEGKREAIEYFIDKHFHVVHICEWKLQKKYDNKTMGVSSKVKAITFTILSAYFINHDTSKPVDPRFNTTIQVVRLYPLKIRLHQGPLSNPLLKSSTRSRAILKITPNLSRKKYLKMNRCSRYTEQTRELTH